MVIKKIGRNDSCPCGSGKKYKQCCQGLELAGSVNNSVAIGYDIQRAITLHTAGQLSEAEAIYKQVLNLSPNNCDALHLLGLISYQTGNSETAVNLISKALSLNSSSLMHNNLGAALQALGRHDAAIDSYRTALSLNPDYAEAYNNLGAALQEQGNLGEAIESFHQALSLKPKYAEAQNNLGNALQSQGQLNAAIDCYRQSLSANPANLSAQSNLLLTLSYCPQSTPSQYLAEARFYGDKVLAQATPYSYWPNFSSSRNKQTLRVGLVSGDFNIHPVGYFLEGMLEHLSADKIELVAYSTRGKEDELTGRIKPLFTRWNIISGMDDESVAHKIYGDAIDILIDLSGHTSSANRLPVFAWKPAPIQVSWLGYFASTGVPGMDFLLADPVSVSESQAENFTEKLWYLPETRLCFTPPQSNKTVASLPALSNGYITFACFQNLSKINDTVIAVWGRIFQALPNARLILRNKQMNCLGARNNLQQRLAKVGILDKQVKIEEPISREDYLDKHAEVDIILDTFPYPGGTTTCEGLWMGVPTLTLAGDTLLARQGASFMSCIGLHEWVASDQNDYVTKAIEFSADTMELSKLRNELRSKLFATSLFNASRFALQFEEALYGMWKYQLSRVL